MVDPACVSRGLAEQAVRSLVRHLIADLGYHRVQLEVYGFNERAVRLFERAGFVREEPSARPTGVTGSGTTASSSDSSRRTSPTA